MHVTKWESTEGEANVEQHVLHISASHHVKYSGDLNSELVQYLNGPKQLNGSLFKP